MEKNIRKIELQALLDQSNSQAEINKAIKQIQEKSKVKLKVEADTSSVLKLASDINRLSKANTMQVWAVNNSKAMRKYGSEVNNLISKFRNLDKSMTSIELQKLHEQFNSIQLQAKQTGDLGATTGEQFKKAWDKFDDLSEATTNFTSFMHCIRDGAILVSEFDDAMSYISNNSEITATGLEKLGNKSLQMGKDMHTSVTNILEAVKNYSTVSSSADDILAKAKPAIMLSTISGMSGTDSSVAIDTSLDQFEIVDTQENLLDIADTLQYVSSQLNFEFSAGIKEISDGIEASGSVAHSAGISMQEYAAMVGFAAEKTGQSGLNIGQTYKTILSRITTASEAEGTPNEDISKAENALQKINIQVRDSNSNFRNLSDTMHDIGNVWDSLTSAQKVDIGFDVAGTKQLDVLNSLFGSWNEYESIISNIDNRTGMTMENQEIYADSLKEHLGELSGTGESLWTNILNLKELKTFVDTFDGLLSNIDKLSSLFGGQDSADLVGSDTISSKRKSLDYRKYDTTQILQGSDKSYCYG